MKAVLRVVNKPNILISAFYRVTGEALVCMNSSSILILLTQGITDM